jgi:hypothetical protein
MSFLLWGEPGGSHGWGVLADRTLLGGVRESLVAQCFQWIDLGRPTHRHPACQEPHPNE